MNNIVQTKRTPVAGRRPTGLMAGELYFNFADRTIGCVDENGIPIDIVTAIPVGPTAPANPVPGILWYRTTSPAGLYVWFVDADSSQWVQVAGGGSGGGGGGGGGGGASVEIGDTPPEAPVEGQFWFSTVEPVGLFIWLVDADSAQWVQAGGGSTAPSAPFAAEENKIINGGFDFWQRGASTSVPDYGAADRWRHDFDGGACVQSRQLHAIGQKLGRNSPTFFHRHTVSGQSLPAHYAITEQRIEGVRSYQGQTITILGWARRSSGAGDMAISARQFFGSGAGSPPVEITGGKVELGADWAPFALTLDIPSVSGKTISDFGNDHLQVYFWASAGADYADRTGGLGLQTIGVDLWGVHIQHGERSVPAVEQYVAPDAVSEIARCQRYFARVEGGMFGSSGIKQATAAQNIMFNAGGTFPVTMRAAPAITRQNPSFLNCNTPSFEADFVAFTERVNVLAAGNYRAFGGYFTFDAEL